MPVADNIVTQLASNMSSANSMYLMLLFCLLVLIYSHIGLPGVSLEDNILPLDLFYF